MHRPRRALVAVAIALGLVAAAQTPMVSVAADAAVMASASNGSASARTTISVRRPDGTQPGHVMVASIVSNYDDPGFSAPAGWTVLRQHTIKDALRHAVYLKVAGEAEPESYAWKVSSGRRLAGGITSFAGVDTAQPLDAVNSAANASSTAVPAPGITTTVPNALLVHLAAVAAEGTVAPPAGMTERWEASAANTSPRTVLASLSESTQTSAGDTGTRAATASQAGKSIGVLLALRPAGAPVPDTDPPDTDPPDTDPPDTAIVSGPSGTTTNAFASFTFSATEAATFRCQLDGGPPGPCTSPKTYVNLAEGAHSFAVVATDRAGNTDPTPANRPWTVDPGGDDPVIVGAGDIGHCGTDNDEATASLLDHIPGRVFVLGDNTYAKAGNGASVTLADFVECYGPTWGRHKDRTVPVVGNHEYVGPNADGYYSYFGVAAGDPAKGYYDYREGAWHVIVLNANCADVGGCGAGSPQEQWLRGVLAASDADCTVAMWHNPLYSSGATHGSDPTYRPFWQALYDHGADVILNGHDHVYERFGLQTPGGAADAVYGMRQFTVGTGGRSSYAFASPLPNSDVRGRSYGVLKMMLHDASYDWEFVPVPGQTFTDRGTTACHGAPDPPPPPPPPPPADGIAVVGSTSDGLASGRVSITLGRPAGTAAGHVLVAAIGANEDTAISAPDGWTTVHQDASGAIRQAVFVKVAGSAEPGSYTWTLSGTRRVAGGITAFSGVDPGQPLDVVDGWRNAPGTAVPAPEVTTTTDGAILVHLATVNAEGTMTAPAGWTEAWEATSPNPTSTRDVLVSSSRALQPRAGPTGSAVATASLAGSSVAVILALRPAP